jgi:oxygen-dependent protoporphyrinogen oxidase
LNAPVQRIEHDGDQWRLSARGLEELQRFDGVILATPARVAGDLLQSIDGELGTALGSIEHEGTAILTVAYRREQISHPLDGMGFVVPGIERSPILAGSFSSQKYVHRAPEGLELLRVFVGGARAAEMAELEESELEARVLPELEKLLGIQGKPIYRTSARWPGTMPQYHVGHLELVQRIQGRVESLPNLRLAGNAYGGVGIPACIHSGEQAAERLLGITK